MALALSRRQAVAGAKERGELAQAIAQQAEVRRRAATLQTAAAVADQRVLHLVREVEAAEQAVRQAGDSIVQHALAVADGDAPPGSNPVADARQQLAAAEAALVDARVTRNALAGRLNVEDTGAGGRYVEACARAVLAAEAAPLARRLAADVVALERDLAATVRVVRFMLRIGALPAVTALGPTHGEAGDTDLRHALQRLSRLHEPDGAGRLESPWVAALAALQQDAAAPLPAGLPA